MWLLTQPLKDLSFIRIEIIKNTGIKITASKIDIIHTIIKLNNVLLKDVPADRI